MGRVDDIPVHTEASAISQIADSDRYGVHSWSARCADKSQSWYMLFVLLHNQRRLLVLMFVQGS